jgi:ATP-dependent HslUV protease ATP-binding subunit HslU
MEKLLEEVSFAAASEGPHTVRIDAAFVNGRLDSVARDEDLARYVL